MRTLMFVFGIMTLGLGLLMVLAIVAIASDYKPYIAMAGALTPRHLMVIAVALALPLVFVGLSQSWSGSPGKIWSPVVLVAASTAALFASIGSFGAGFAKYAATGFVDPKRLFATFSGSPAVIIGLFVAWSIAWILFGFSLKPTKPAPLSASPSKVLCVLSGIAGLSLVGLPIQFVLISLTYCSLGFYLMSAKPARAAKDERVYIDDYRPA